MSERSIEAPPPSTSCAAASPARISASPAPAPASTESARGCGESSSVSLATWDPATSSWRTSQRCLFEGWARFSESWPRAGSMRRGIAYPRRPSAPLTAATGSSWSRGEYPTPSATPYGSAQNEGTIPHDRPTRGTPSLDTWARKRASWPTPTASMATPADLEQARFAGNDPRRPSYADATRAPWATPQAHDAKGARGPASASKKGSRCLSLEVKSWPTPVASDSKGGVRPRQLNERVICWPTPTAGDSRSSGSRVGNPETKAHPGVSLTDAACRSGLPDPTTSTPGLESPSRLNPRFVEWLMGLPDEWTRPSAEHAFMRSETPSCPPPSRSSVDSSSRPSASACAHSMRSRRSARGGSHERPSLSLARVARPAREARRRARVRRAASLASPRARGGADRARRVRGERARRRGRPR